MSDTEITLSDIAKRFDDFWETFHERLVALEKAVHGKEADDGMVQDFMRSINLETSTLKELLNNAIAAIQARNDSIDSLAATIKNLPCLKGTNGQRDTSCLNG